MLPRGISARADGEHGRPLFGTAVRRAILDRGRLARSVSKSPKCAPSAMIIAVRTGAKMRARRPRSADGAIWRELFSKQTSCSLTHTTQE